jgi:hypothetical protein
MEDLDWRLFVADRGFFNRIQNEIRHQVVFVRLLAGLGTKLRRWGLFVDDLERGDSLRFVFSIHQDPVPAVQRDCLVIRMADNHVDTKFDKIYTFNFFPTKKGNNLIKLREAAEAKIHAFIEMLGGCEAAYRSGGNQITKPVLTVEFQGNRHRRKCHRGQRA